MGFTCEEDARRVLEVLPQRFGKYGLTLHPDKTRLVPFQPPDRHRPPGLQREVIDQGRLTCWVSPITGAAPGRVLGGEAADGPAA